MFVNHLRDEIIIPTLKALDNVKPGILSDAAINLLIGTAAQESRMGYYLVQLGIGLASNRSGGLGIYQMEARTHDDIWVNYLNYYPALSSEIKNLSGNCRFMYRIGNGGIPCAMNMIGNLYYASAMARMHYLRVEQELPDSDDIAEIAKYWKYYYNTQKGKGSIQDFIKNYNYFLGREK